MQVYVQKSTSTTFPRSAAVVSGGELSHPVAPSKPGSRPSLGSGAGPACFGDLTGSPAAPERGPRISSEKSCGSSQAAKCPPLSTSLKYMTFG